MSKRIVPALNLSDYYSSDLSVKSKFKTDLYNSFKEFGFVVINNHAVDSKLLKKAYDIQGRFFSLPDSTKRNYFVNNGGQRGYTSFGVEHAKGAAASDLKEFWHIGRELDPSDTEYSSFEKNVWPVETPEFKQTFLDIFQELQKVGDSLLEALEEPFNLPDGFFKSATHNGNSILRLLHYPPVQSGVDPKAIRAGAHTDINVITLLVASTEKRGGLELLDKNGEWIPVDGIKDSIIVNMGDMLSRITNDHIPSTVHRVINPDPTHNVSRYSMPFFHNFRSDFVLNPVDKFKQDPEKYPVITAGEFLLQRLKEIGLKK